ncbi:MAG: helix-turn-helix transcriptional regulator [Oscillospiraceae bacterium]|nr:helix-turn-helix transcriptional regulator [Oscillospiraceae bacterium]
MNELYTRIEALCRQRGISVTTMCREAGVNRGNLSDLKTGRQSGLSKKNLEKLAAYFDVTPAYLMGWTSEADAAEGKDPQPSARPEVTEEDIKFALFGGTGALTDEMYNEVKEFVKFVKMKHGGLE